MTESPDSGGVPAVDGDLPVWDLLSTISAPVPWYALAYLRMQETATLTELADVVTGWSNAGSGRIATPADRDRIRIALYHVHLPALAATGIITFDPDERTATMRELSEPMEAALDWVSENHATGDHDGVP